VLASSRPDLIEVDLKRPGRIDLKVPILPTTTRAESRELIAALARRYELPVSATELQQLDDLLPLMLTPGAAEALVMKAYRLHRTRGVSGGVALSDSLRGYQNPVQRMWLDKQIRLAVREPVICRLCRIHASLFFGKKGLRARPQLPDRCVGQPFPDGQRVTFAGRRFRSDFPLTGGSVPACGGFP